MTRIWLAIVGAAYLVLAGWCVIAPGRTSAAVGFDLQPGSGQSEYVTVYGGFQLAIGLIFLWPLYREGDTLAALKVCLALHACLVLFRGVSLVAFRGVGTTTWVLAGVEWAIFLPTLILWWRFR